MGSTTRPPSDEPEFVPIRPNPYIVGNPVRDRSMFFGREAEFELVRRRFSDSTRGGLLIFCGERRSGKTSILFQILDNRLGPDFIPVLVDMQSMAITSEMDFLAKVSEEILDALGPEAQEIQLPQFAAGSSPAAALQRFIEEVLRAYPNRKLILLFDEYELFENKIDSGVLGPDILQILASLMENQSVFLVFTGSQHLEQRKQKYWQILPKSIWKRISYLEREDALKLIRKPVQGLVHYGEGAVEAIYRLTAGQPFYTQAICQSLVDQLNEKRTNQASRDSVFEVVEDIVNNPLPQMIFLWDSLERDEKLVLALLAESLEDGDAFATQEQVSRTIRQRKYPLALGRARIAQALEKLFKDELLQKRDATPPAYAFLMDLWRLWIRRMHSVWQVMREEGLEIRGGSPRRRLYALAGTAAALLAVALFLYPGFVRVGPPPAPSQRAGPRAPLLLRASPASAAIFFNGRQVDWRTRRSEFAVYEDTVEAGIDHTVSMLCAGYADTTFRIRLVEDELLERTVAMRPRLGAVRITTTPAGAAVIVDGSARGPSPVTVGGLRVSDVHTVEVELADHNPAREEFQVRPDTMITVSMLLARGTTTLMVTTEPLGAAVAVDGRPSGRSPVSLHDVPLGSHTIAARLAGYADAVKTVDVVAGNPPIHLELQREPPGRLEVMGDYPAEEIYIDGQLVLENVPHASRSVAAGMHEILVVARGDSVRQSVAVGPREVVKFDFTRRTIDRSVPQ